jgi:hypothetical protein
MCILYDMSYLSESYIIQLDEQNASKHADEGQECY